MLCTFFFSSRRRHTRWNCDWSSDVCSSDLGAGVLARMLQGALNEEAVAALRDERLIGDEQRVDDVVARVDAAAEEEAHRSEERRVGKEGRWRWSPEHLNKSRQKHDDRTRH